MLKLLLLLTSFCCLYFLVILLKVFYEYWWIPLRLQRLLRSQGINGPPYKFIHGNNHEFHKFKKEALNKPMALTHDVFPKVLPHIHYCINKYGKTYLFWDGIRAQLVTIEPELVKEVMKDSDKAFPKRKPPIYNSRLVGDGLVATVVREKWARQRKLANCGFHGDSLKNMTPAVVASVEQMLEKWKGLEGKEIEVFQEFRFLTSEIISRTAFGSSYLEGEKIFDMFMKLSLIATRNRFKAKIPIISKFWKTDDDIESEKLAKRVEESLMEIVKKREDKVKNGKADSYGNDFLGLLLNAYHNLDEKNRLSLQDVLDECKTFYFAGHETTNSLLGWTVFLLAVHRDWQEKARKEVFEIFGNQNPDFEGLAKLKIMTMIINETLRLYAPVNGLTRKARREVQLGKLVLPANIEFFIPNMALHHDPQLWGDDAQLFKPERFAEGIAKATKYNAAAFIPFGMGPRTCVGMSFATTETKTALSMILQRYFITLSAAYVHSPLPFITLQPQHGIQVILHSLQTDA